MYPCLYYNLKDIFCLFSLLYNLYTDVRSSQWATIYIYNYYYCIRKILNLFEKQLRIYSTVFHIILLYYITPLTVSKIKSLTVLELPSTPYLLPTPRPCTRKYIQTCHLINYIYLSSCRHGGNDSLLAASKLYSLCTAQHIKKKESLT